MPEGGEPTRAGYTFFAKRSGGLQKAGLWGSLPRLAIFGKPAQIAFSPKAHQAWARVLLPTENGYHFYIDKIRLE
jgi:hypothetical protein